MNSKGKPLTDLEYIQLLWPMIPNVGEVDGSLDWVTGIMALSVAPDAWQNPQKQPADQLARINRAFSHELFHLIQISTLGFVRNWVDELKSLVHPVAKRVQADFAHEDASVVTRLIEQGSKLLTDMERRAFDAHFARLDKPGMSGLTVRAIVESQAFFFERRMNYQMVHSSAWTPHLRDAPEPMYRIAFDFLAFAAGFRTAWEWFPLIASRALCEKDPVDAFERMTLALIDGRVGREVYDQMPTLPQVVDLINKVIGNDEWDSPLTRTSEPHPVFRGVRDVLAAQMKSRGITVVQFFAFRHDELRFMHEWGRLNLPIIFRTAGTSQLGIQLMPQLGEGGVLAMFAIGAIGRRLAFDAEWRSQKIGAAAIRTLDWLVRDHDVVRIGLSAEMIRRPDASLLTKPFDPYDDKRDACKAWGRVMLVLPSEFDPSGDKYLPQISEGRRFMEAVRNELPMFFVYLAPPHGFYEWFGSLGKLTAQGMIDLADPPFVDLVDGTRNAIADMGVKIGRNPWLALQVLLEVPRMMIGIEGLGDVSLKRKVRPADATSGSGIAECTFVSDSG